MKALRRFFKYIEAQMLSISQSVKNKLSNYRKDQVTMLCYVSSRFFEVGDG